MSGGQSKADSEQEQRSSVGEGIGHLNQRPSFTNLLFTGERVIDDGTQENLFREHLQRYRLASRHVDGKNVLDVGSGSGYGASYLQEWGAKATIGIDVSSEAICYARERYSAPGLHFLIGDSENIPLDGKSIDVVLCFETIEHVHRHDRALDEIVRVLRSDGLLMLSTPNRRLASPGNNMGDPPGNKYHLREFTQDEVQDILGSHFKQVKIQGQSFFFRPFLRSFWSTQTPSLRLAKRYLPIVRGQLPLFEPHVLVAWCRWPMR